MHHMQEREASIKQETADLKLLIEANTALTEDRTTDGEGEAERGELGVTSAVDVQERVGIGAETGRLVVRGTCESRRSPAC